MKKTILCIIIYLATLLQIVAFASNVDPYYQDMIDDSIVFKMGTPITYAQGQRKVMDVNLLLVEDRCLVPVRYVCEWFGGKVDWNQAQNCVEMTIGGNVIQLTPGSNVMWINGAQQYAEVAPVTFADRTYVPIRFLADMLGKYTYFVGTNKPIIISSYAMYDDYLMGLIGHIDGNYDFAENHLSWKQSDVRWGHMSIGHGYTMKNAGCLITSVNIALIEAGLKRSDELNPGTFCQQLLDGGGLTEYGDLKWYQAGKITGTTITYHSKKPTVQELIQIKESGKQIVLNVRGGGHWVYFIGIEGEDKVLVADVGYHDVTDYKIGDVVGYITIESNR